MRRIHARLSVLLVVLLLTLCACQSPSVTPSPSPSVTPVPDVPDISGVSDAQVFDLLSLVEIFSYDLDQMLTPDYETVIGYEKDGENSVEIYRCENPYGNLGELYRGLGKTYFANGEAFMLFLRMCGYQAVGDEIGALPADYEERPYLDLYTAIYTIISSDSPFVTFEINCLLRDGGENIVRYVFELQQDGSLKIADMSGWMDALKEPEILPAEYTPVYSYGYANADGNKLIVLYDPEVSDIRLLNYFDYAIGENGEAHKITFSHYQESGYDNNGRDNMWNFDRQNGCIFTAGENSLVPNMTYVLITKEEYEDITLLKPGDNHMEEISAELISECERLSGRNVKRGYVLSEYTTGSNLSIIEFEPQAGELLAWVVLEKAGAVKYGAFPVSVNDDYAGWKIGDSGRIHEESIEIICSFEKHGETIVVFSWFGEESESIKMLVFDDGATAAEREGSNRYISGV